MNKLLILLVFILTSSVYGAELKIINWYELNRSNNSDSAAEVCFSLNPAPNGPVFAQITVDANRRSEAFYNSWIGPRGSVCHVVSTARGLVEVEIPSLKLKTSLNKK